MEALLLDVRTLAFASGLGGLIMGATMLGLGLAGTRTRGWLAWASGGFVFGAGYLMGHLLLTLPGILPGWAAGALANALIGAGHVLILLGVQRYLGRRPWAWWLLGSVAVMLLASLASPWVRHHADLNMVWHSGTYILSDVAAALLLWRASWPGLTAFRRAVAVVLLAFAAFLAVRAGYALLSNALVSSFVRDGFQLMTFVASLLFGFVLTMALVLMVFREKELGLRRIARHDALTGLHNRHALAELAAREVAVAQRYGRALSLVAVDLDHFKQVNDRYGHAAGDAVLCGAAAVLQQALRQTDLLFRTGGEEFLVVLPCTGSSEAVQVAERLRVAIEQAEWPAAGVVLRATASFGVAELAVRHEIWEQLLRRVDRALYEAKEAGRNQVCAAAATQLVVAQAA